MSSDDEEKIIVGSPSRGIPEVFLPIFFHPGSKLFKATICDHFVALAPTGQEAFATGEYGLICNDCLESYTILRGGPVEEPVVMPGSVKELEEQFGVEGAQQVIKEGTPELRRRLGLPTEEEKQ